MWEGHFSQGNSLRRSPEVGEWHMRQELQRRVWRLGEAVEQGCGGGAHEAPRLGGCFLRFPLSPPPAASLSPSAPKPGHMPPAQT